MLFLYHIFNKIDSTNCYETACMGPSVRLIKWLSLYHINKDNHFYILYTCRAFIYNILMFRLSEQWTMVSQYSG